MSLISRIDAMIAELEAIKQEIVSNKVYSVDFKPIMPQFKVGDIAVLQRGIEIKDDDFKAYKIPYNTKIKIISINSEFKEYRYGFEVDYKGKKLIDSGVMVTEYEIKKET